ncbi:cardiolipin synthase (CMP-forming) isoform X2 [Scyliorhinus canicula]|uniref:cardiolipin synthase (CMP-forming) isoform X2 n=1 Tax=Scyliorhinus canicula TaxID=7830 RepID=UPI0018F76AEB|nr:cardiolipin synthase (CMP-forming) isoform X2 [Scyliorhinus canicula]
MFLWKSRWVIGRAVSRPVIFDGPYCWAHTRLLSSAGPGAGRRRLVPGSGLAWWSSPHARGRRREVAHGCGGRDYGIGKAFTKKEAARPYPPRRVGEKEQGEERATGPPELLDGYIARNWANQKSALGSALDPLADKILISVLYVSLTCAELIPAPLTATVLLRDVTLIAAGFYIRYRTVPPPRTLSKYFNPCYATAQLKPTFISKVNTAVQLVLVAASLAAPVFQYVDSVFLHALWYATALTTTASAYSYYIHGKNTVQVLNRMK